MCFLWGFQDSGANCLIRSMMGTEFDSKLIPFSVFNFTQSLTVFAAQLIEAKVTDSKGVSIDDQKSNMQNYMIANLAWAVLALGSLLFFKFKSKDNVDEMMEGVTNTGYDNRGKLMQKHLD